MDETYHEDLMAELAALNVMAIKAMASLTVLASATGPKRKDFLERHLRSGEEALAQTNYWSIAEGRREAVIEKARERLTDMIDAVYRATK
jgi:hypothetical protein